MLFHSQELECVWQGREGWVVVQSQVFSVGHKRDGLLSSEQGNSTSLVFLPASPMQGPPTQGKFCSTIKGAWTLEPDSGLKSDSGSTGYKLFDLFGPQLPQMSNADTNTSLRVYIIKCRPQGPAVWYLLWLTAISTSNNDLALGFQHHFPQLMSPSRA